MSAATQITVAEFLEVRKSVAAVVRTKTTSTATDGIAEALLDRGFIDIDAVLDHLHPERNAAPPLPLELEATVVAEPYVAEG